MKAIVSSLLLLFFTLVTSAQSNNIGAGISLSFNGNTSNAVSLEDSYNSLDFPLTVESWVKLNQYAEFHSDILSSDNSTFAYYGFFFSIQSSGVVRIEFGDGQGSGYGNRAGYNTNAAVPLNQWIHIAAVCNSATDVTIYINGVEQSITKTDGAASITSLTHSSGDATIGWRQDAYGSYAMNGQMDEVRLWGIGRSETDIQNNMCSKLTGTESGLIGYWKGDESYISNIVQDFSPSGINGTIIGAVSRTTSGAPVGDASTALFPLNAKWAGLHVSISSLFKDKLTVQSVKNNPVGIIVYRVDSTPYFTHSLNKFTHFYFGVFPIEGTSTATYKIVYAYSGKNNVENKKNEPKSSLFERPDGTQTFWTNSVATLDTSGNHLTLTNVNAGAEYIFNILSSPERQPQQASDAITAYPNPFSNSLHLQTNKNESVISIMNASGLVVYQSHLSSSNIEINTSAWAAGIYIASIQQGTEKIYEKVVLVR